MIVLTREPLDVPGRLGDFLNGRRTTGAVAAFAGLAREASEGLVVDRLVLDAHPAFTGRVMAQIEQEALSRFAVQDVLAVHRWGPILPGEPIVFVAAAAEHRRAAFEAADYLMDQFKVRAPFWKKEEGPDGARWIEPRASDHVDLDRWRGRMEDGL